MITVCAYDASKQKNTALIRSLMKAAGQENYTIHDMAVSKISEDNLLSDIVTIGAKAARVLSDKEIILQLPSFSYLQRNLIEALTETKKAFIKSPDTASHQVHGQTGNNLDTFLCETQQGSTVRISNTPGQEDINLSLEEVQKIKAIMNIFGCSQVTAIITNREKDER